MKVVHINLQIHSTFGLVAQKYRNTKKQKNIDYEKAKHPHFFYGLNPNEYSLRLFTQI